MSARIAAASRFRCRRAQWANPPSFLRCLPRRRSKQNRSPATGRLQRDTTPALRILPSTRRSLRSSLIAAGILPDQPDGRITVLHEAMAKVLPLPRRQKMQKPRMQPRLLRRGRQGGSHSLGFDKRDVEPTEVWWWHGCAPVARGRPTGPAHMQSRPQLRGRKPQFGLGSRPYSCIFR